MSAFCPDGYIYARRAISKLAIRWFSEELDAKAAAIGGAPQAEPGSGAEALALALSQPRIYGALLQEAKIIRSWAEHRLRNHLHQGEPSAYYFGDGLFTGCHAIEPEFWATPQADGVLEEGTYFPLGRPERLHQQRPKYEIFLRQQDLDALLTGQPSSRRRQVGANRRPGRPPRVAARVEAEMREHMAQGHDLCGMPEKEMKHKFKAARSTCRKVRLKVLA